MRSPLTGGVRTYHGSSLPCPGSLKVFSHGGRCQVPDLGVIAVSQLPDFWLDVRQVDEEGSLPFSSSSSVFSLYACHAHILCLNAVPERLSTEPSLAIKPSFLVNPLFTMHSVSYLLAVFLSTATTVLGQEPTPTGTSPLTNATTLDPDRYSSCAIIDKG
jgi:hypothetical protein